MRPWRLFSLSSFVAVLLLVSSTGCDRGEVLGRVTGVVKCEGQPVPGAMVIFRNDQKGVHMMARCDDAGKFTVEMAKGSGLPLGEYDVCVGPPIQDHPLGPIKAPPPGVDPYLQTIPRKYRDIKTSNIKLVVKELNEPLLINMLRE